MLQIRRTIFSLLLCLGIVGVSFFAVLAGKAFQAGRNGPHVEYPETSAPLTTQAPETEEPYVPANADATESEDPAGEEKTSNPDETEAPEETAAPTTTEKSEETTEREEKVIYLTFDDGPGEHTERLLNILKKHGVRVTFFVTAMYGYQDLIAREAREGHAVGVHSYSHKYDKIYASTQAFWDDFEKMQAIVTEQTGVETKLMRFPGGSSNTVSNFTPGIMTALVEQAEERGLVYVDWNISSGDAGETRSSSTVLENCKRGVSQCRTSVILCHDVKGFTVDAMDDFITWALDEGYTFRPLTTESWPAHHKVFN